MQDNMKAVMKEMVTPTTLTEENVEELVSTITEEVQQNDQLKMIADLPSNQGVQDHAPEEGEYKKAMVNIDPTTGERSIASFIEDDEPDGESNIGNIFDENFEILPEDINASVKDSAFLEEDKFKISDESTLELIKIINRYRAGENFSLYSAFPQEVKDMVNTYLMKEGYGGFSVQANTMRNTLSKMLIEEFISNIEINKYTESFNKELESIFSEAGKEISTMYKDYDIERDKYLKEVLDKIPEEEVEKREKLTAVMDNIHEGYTMSQLKEYAKKTKIKAIEMEKPQQWAFNIIESKYQDKSYSIYQMSMILDLLNRHNPDMVENNGNLAFLILFCKYCQNFDPANIKDHVYMYYTIYNIVLLDIYKDTEYEEFAPGLLQNINDVINNIKKF